MHKRVHERWLILMASAGVLLTGCGAMEPKLPVTEPGIPVDWPSQPALPGSIQSAFREVADALALTRTLAEQIRSREALLEAAENADELSRRRYEAGSDSYLVRLDSQRTLYTAQQALVSTLLAQQANRITLYKVLGGGWQ